jgi:trafficking protein particle complex subunit 10
MLLMQGECLKTLNRRDDYVRLLLGLLAKTVARKISPSYKNLVMSSDDFDLESHQIDGQSILAELLTFSTQLPYEVTVKMSTYFTNITVDPYIRHFSNDDGFQIRLRFRHILEDPMRIDQVKLLLSSKSEGFTKQIFLTSEGPVRITKGAATVTVQTNVSTLHHSVRLT